MRSMTGWGRGHVTDEIWDVTADIRSVNHRFLDISARLPNDLLFLHDVIRKEAGQRLKRGHLDVALSVKKIGQSDKQVTVNEDIAALYLSEAKKIAEKYNCEFDLSVSKLLALDGVCQTSSTEIDTDTVSSLTRDAVNLAFDELIRMREDEGKRLALDLETHLLEAEKLWEAIKELAPRIAEEYRIKLLSRLEAFQLESIDEARLAQEVALIADRCAIDEELSRLSSHFQQMHTYLSYDSEIGKKMDFLIQEMNREANTIGSKAMDAKIAQHVVNLKSEIEKMREQIQNVE